MTEPFDLNKLTWRLLQNEPEVLWPTRAVAAKINDHNALIAAKKVFRHRAGREPTL